MPFGGYQAGRSMWDWPGAAASQATHGRHLPAGPRAIRWLHSTSAPCPKDKLVKKAGAARGSSPRNLEEHTTDAVPSPPPGAIHARVPAVLTRSPPACCPEPQDI